VDNLDFPICDVVAIDRINRLAWAVSVTFKEIVAKRARKVQAASFRCDGHLKPKGFRLCRARANGRGTKHHKHLRKD